MTTMTGAYGSTHTRRRTGERAAAAAGRWLARVLPRWPSVRRFALVLSGFGAVDYGVWLVSRPAGFIVAGVCALLLDWLTE